MKMKSALVQIMTWCQEGDKPLFSPMLTFSFNPFILLFFFIKAAHVLGTQLARGSAGIIHVEALKKKHFSCYTCVTSPLWGESTGHLWIPLIKASNTGLWSFFYVCLNKWLSKQSRCWWFKMLWHSLWPHCYVNIICTVDPGICMRRFHASSM